MTYDVFISYSHRARRPLARAVQIWLNRLGKPWWRRRTLRVFRDESDLAADASGIRRILSVLDSCEWLILIATPEAAASKWVRREVRHWLGEADAAGRPVDTLDAPVAGPDPEKARQTLIVLAKGDIIWCDADADKPGDFDWTRTTALPPCLAGVFADEPIWVDVRGTAPPYSRRNPAFIADIARLAAPVRGLELAEMIGEDTLRYRQTIRAVVAALVAISVASVVAIFGWIEATRQERAARVNESAALAALSDVTLSEDPSGALKLALAAWPREGREPPARDTGAIDAIGASMRAGPRLRVSVQTGGIAYDGVFSPDGERLATAGEAGRLATWDAATGSMLQDLEGHDTGEVVRSVAFSRDGRFLLSASSDGTARVWPLDPPGDPLVLRHEEGGLYDAAFSPDGRTVATAGEDGTARLWNARDGALRRKIDAHEGSTLAVAFSPDGRHLATSSNTSSVKVWDTGYEEPSAILKTSQLWNKSVDFSPDGRTVLIGAEGRSAWLWDFLKEDAEVRPLEGHTYSVNRARYAPGGRFFVTASDDRYAILYDRDGTVRARFGPAEDWLYGAAVSPDLARVATVGRDGRISVWDVDEAAPTMTLPVNDLPIFSLAVSADGAHLAAASLLAFGLIDAESGATAASVQTGRLRAGKAAFAPDGKAVYVVYGDPSGYDGYHVRRWDKGADEPVPFNSGHEELINDLTVSEDGQYILTASSDGTVRLWTAQGHERARYEGHAGRVTTARFPCHFTVMTASIDGTIRIWDRISGNPVQTIRVNEGGDQFGEGVEDAAYSQNCDWIVHTAGNDAVVWDTHGEAPLFRFSGHTRPLTSVSFLPGDSRILTASMDGTARIWDVATGLELARMETPEGAIWDAVHDPVSGRIFTAGGDGVIRGWTLTLPEGNFFEVACATLPWRDGARDLSFERLAAGGGLEALPPLPPCAAYNPPFPARAAPE